MISEHNGPEFIYLAIPCQLKHGGITNPYIMHAFFCQNGYTESFDKLF